MYKYKIAATFILISMLIESCSHSSESLNKNEHAKKDVPVNFKAYYDFKETKLKSRGFIIDGKESGEWIFYDTLGTEIEKGNYEKGIQSGKWQYNLPSIESLVIWKSFSNILSKYTFSLPSSFKPVPNGIVFTAIDTISKEVFTLQEIDYYSENDYNNYLMLIDNQIKQELDLLSKSFLKVATEYNFYHFNYYHMYNKAHNFEQDMYLICVPFKNKLIILNLNCTPERKERAKWLIGEIYYHLFDKQGERVDEPWRIITEIVQE